MPMWFIYMCTKGCEGHGYTFICAQEFTRTGYGDFCGYHGTKGLRSYGYGDFCSYQGTNGLRSYGYGDFLQLSRYKRFKVIRLW